MASISSEMETYAPSAGTISQVRPITSTRHGLLTPIAATAIASISIRVRSAPLHGDPQLSLPLIAIITGTNPMTLADVPRAKRDIPESAIASMGPSPQERFRMATSP